MAREPVENTSVVPRAQSTRAVTVHLPAIRSRVARKVQMVETLLPGHFPRVVKVVLVILQVCAQVVDRLPCFGI